MKITKEAILGKSLKGKIVMGVFAFLLAVTLLLGLRRCQDPYPIKTSDGSEFRLIEEAVDPKPIEGHLGNVAVYEKKGR
jgi:hypothetical protein